MSAEEVLTQAFRDADVECDWTAEGHATHALDALKSAGYAVVELSPAENSSGDVSDWWGGDIWCTTGSGRLRIYVQDARFSADEARGFAADVLSAAEAADPSKPLVDMLAADKRIAERLDGAK